MTPLHCVASGVFPGSMPEKLSKSWWIYLRMILFTEGRDFYCDWNYGADNVLGVRHYCVRNFNTKVSVVFSYRDISVGCMIEMYVFDAALCIDLL